MHRTWCHKDADLLSNQLVKFSGLLGGQDVFGDRLDRNLVDDLAKVPDRRFVSVMRARLGGPSGRRFAPTHRSRGRGLSHPEKLPLSEFSIILAVNSALRIAGCQGRRRLWPQGELPTDEGDDDVHAPAVLVSDDEGNGGESCWCPAPNSWLFPSLLIMLNR